MWGAAGPLLWNRSVIVQDTGKHSSQSGVQMEHAAQRDTDGGATVYTIYTVYTGPSPRELCPQSWVVPVAAAWPSTQAPLKEEASDLGRQARPRVELGPFQGYPSPPAPWRMGHCGDRNQEVRP